MTDDNRHELDFGSPLLELLLASLSGIITGLMLAIVFGWLAAAHAADLDLEYRTHVYQADPAVVVIAPEEPRCHVERVTDHDGGAVLPNMPPIGGA